MPCGYDVPRSHEEALEHADELRSVGAREIVAVDAGATFSRPGPRLVDGLELLAHIAASRPRRGARARRGRPAADRRAAVTLRAVTFDFWQTIAREPQSRSAAPAAGDALGGASWRGRARPAARAHRRGAPRRRAPSRARSGAQGELFSAAEAAAVAAAELDPDIDEATTQALVEAFVGSGEGIELELTPGVEDALRRARRARACAWGSSATSASRAAGSCATCSSRAGHPRPLRRLGVLRRGRRLQARPGDLPPRAARDRRRRAGRGGPHRRPAPHGRRRLARDGHGVDPLPRRERRPAGGRARGPPRPRRPRRARSACCARRGTARSRARGDEPPRRLGARSTVRRAPSRAMPRRTSSTPSIGYRQWRMHERRAALRATRRTAGQPGPMTAECHAEAAHAEPPPVNDCSCGFYARYTPVPRTASAGHARPRRGRGRAVGAPGAARARACAAEHAQLVSRWPCRVLPGPKRRRVREVADALGVPAVPARAAAGRRRCARARRSRRRCARPTSSPTSARRPARRTRRGCTRSPTAGGAASAG